MAHPISRRTWLAGALAAAAEEPLLRLPKKVRLALIGLEGHTGEILDPLPRLPDVEIAAICDPDARLLAAAARRPALARARQYSDYRQLLAREDLEMAAVCGSNGTRAEILLACAARKLHLVAEKPLALDHASLQRVRQAVAAAGVRLTMLLPMRFWGVYRAMRRIVDSGEIGEVAQMGAQKSYKLGDRPTWMRRRASFGGTIPYIGIHMVDLMRFTSRRELVETAALEARVGFPELGDLENTTATLFRLDNGGNATLRMDYLRTETSPTHGDDRLRLAGTRGILEYQEASGLTLTTRRSKPRLLADIPPNRFLFVDFLNSVYHGVEPALSLADIYRANDLVLAARDSAEQHRFIPI